MALSLRNTTEYAVSADLELTKGKMFTTSIPKLLMAPATTLLRGIAEAAHCMIQSGSLRNASRDIFTEENESLQDAGNVF